jgi:hypothetical protein
LLSTSLSESIRLNARVSIAPAARWTEGSNPASSSDESNANLAIRQVKPFGVDLSSGVRTEGRLDERKLTAFVLSVRKADEVRGSA